MIPPSSVWAEKALLGCLVRDNLPWPENGLLPSHFFDPQNQTVAAACHRLKAEGKDLDEFTVSDAITSSGAAADAHYINSLTSSDCPLVYSRNWADTIIKTASLRRIGELGRKLSDLAGQPDADPAQLAAFTEGTLKTTPGIRDSRTANAVPPPLDFKSLVAFVPDEDTTCVLGNRYLCKGGSCMIVAQTGAGKSALVAHAALSFAIGRDFFGVRSKKGPLTSIIIQSENDGGDVAESVQGYIDGQGIPRASQLVDQMADRVFYYREAVKTGVEFGDLLRTLVTLHKADIVFVDPLLGFAGVDLSDQEASSHFLRQIVQPVLADTGVILFSVHHTTKPPKEKGSVSMADLSYAGAGSAELANWHRAVMVLQKDATPEGEEEQPNFTLRFAKRGGRAGARDSRGNFTTSVRLRHSRVPGRISWERRNEDDTPEGHSDSRPAKASPSRF